MASGGSSGGGGGKSGGSSGGGGGGKSGGSSGGSSGGGGGKSGGSSGGGGAAGPVQRNTAQCPSFVGARVVRLTRLNSCGAPMFGRENVVTTRGVVSASFEPEIDEGDSLDTKNLNGELCVQGTTPDSMSGLSVTLEFCQVDPAVFQIFNPNWKLVRNSRDDHSGDVTGFRIGSNVSDEFGFALEMWPKTMGMNSQCEADEEPDPSDPRSVHGYFLLPFVAAKAPDEWELKGDEVATFSMKGMTKGGGGWDVGPFVVTRDEAQAPSPLLRPIEDGSGKGGFKHPVTQQVMKDPDHFHAEVVSVTPPEPACGAQDLMKPKIDFKQEAGGVSVTLLNPDEVAPPDPMTGARPPVWVSWGDGTPRTNLTDPKLQGEAPPSEDIDDLDDTTPNPEEPEPQPEPEPKPDQDQGEKPDVNLTQDPNNPRRVTAEGTNLREPAIVDWGADVQEPDQSGGTGDPVRLQQDPQRPRQVTAELQDASNAVVDWGADVSPQNGGQQPVQIEQDPNNPRRITAKLAGQQPATVDWGADVQEGQNA